MLDLFTVVWGKMIESFTELTLPSLVQQWNVPESKHLLGTYTIYSDKRTMQAVCRSLAYQKLAGLMEVEWEMLKKGRWEVNSNILVQMDKSIARGHYMLVVSPDWCLANGSLRNMAELCIRGEHNPILWGFPRVTEEGYQMVKLLLAEGKEISSRQLVHIAMRHIEQTTYPIFNMVKNWVVSNNTWVVQHNVPTPCLKPDTWVKKTFATNPTVNSGYDHTLPYLMIKEGYPWHIIRDSDTYFQIERGRHLIVEHGPDNSRWRIPDQLSGLEFFGTLDQIWQGV